jgi:hypothetical protein
MAAGLTAFRKNVLRQSSPGFVIHAGEGRLPLGDGVTAIPFRDI